MQTHRRPVSIDQFRLETLESRALLSATPITFDPAGTLVKGTGTINGVKYIELAGGGGGGSINGIPTGGGHAPSRALVFATDLDTDGIVDANEITGISVSDGVKMTVYGDVNGDIVTNLRGSNDLSGDTNDGSVLLDNNVKEITIHGSVFGNIVAGHALNKITIDGSVNNLMVGTAANGATFKFHGDEATPVSFTLFSLGTNEKGGSVEDVTIGDGVAGVFAGSGGPSGDGGDINKLTIRHDTGGVIIQAGDGGSDDDHSGGDGGSVFSLRINSSEGATVLAGDAGSSTNPNAIGGVGGSILSAAINAVGPVALSGGDGGTDTATNSRGGDGGAVLNAKIAASDLTVAAGHGGDGSVLGGAGGSLTNVSGVLGGEGNFFAGNGGDSPADAGDGGAVKSLKFVSGVESAFIRAIVAGNGGSGTPNGDGGSITSVKFDGDIGDFGSAYGVSDMGGLFAGMAGTAVGGLGVNGNVTGIGAARIAAIVAGTDDAPQAVKQISGIKANAIGANFDADSDNEGVTEPAFDYFETILPGDAYNIGEVPIDGLVLGFKIGSLPVTPLFKFETNTGIQSGQLDPHVGP